MKKYFLLILTIVFVVLGTGCHYSPPEGWTKKPHTYEEALAYAKSIDPEAEVSIKHKDEKDSYNTYKVWDAKINGIDCSVASVSDKVFNDGFMAGEYPDTFYRLETDYDTIIINEMIKDYPELGQPQKTTLSTRFWGNYSSQITDNDMTEAKLKKLWASYVKFNEEIDRKSLHKDYWLFMEINNYPYCFDKPNEEVYKDVHDKIFSSQKGE